MAEDDKKQSERTLGESEALTDGAKPNAGAEPDNGSLDNTLSEALNEISLNVVVEVGRTVMAVKDICRQFRAGNVVRLDKQKGEPLEVFVNGLLFARAEVVFEGDQIGARIIEVVDADGASRTANSLHFLR